MMSAVAQAPAVNHHISTHVDLAFCFVYSSETTCRCQDARNAPCSGEIQEEKGGQGEYQNMGDMKIESGNAECMILTCSGVMGKKGDC